MIDDIHLPMAGRHNETRPGGSLRRGIAEKVECEESEKNPSCSHGVKNPGRQVGEPGGAGNYDHNGQCQKNKFERRAPGLPRMFHTISLTAKTTKIQTNFKAQ